MKILVILGARKNGNTHHTTQALIKEMTKFGEVDKEYLFLKDYNLKYCLGCRVCFNNGETACPLNDDLLVILDKIKKADGVIFASPVFVNNVSGIMKTLIDRMAFITYRPAFFTKCSYIVTTTHSVGNKHARKSIGAATFAWGFYHVGSLGLRIPTVSGSPDLSRYQKQIKKAAKNFYNAIETKHFKKPSLMALAIFKIQQRSWNKPEYEGTLDYNYWLNNDYSNPKRSFFIDIETNWVKKTIAKIMSGVILRIYS